MRSAPAAITKCAAGEARQVGCGVGDRRLHRVGDEAVEPVAHAPGGDESIGRGRQHRRRDVTAASAHGTLDGRERLHVPGQGLRLEHGVDSDEAAIGGEVGE